MNPLKVDGVFRTTRRALLLIVTVLVNQALLSASRGADDVPDIFAKDNLVAWCIVPFDAEKRTPELRVAMLKRLGLTRVAYDWREEHVPSFESEILEYKKAGIEFFAFWDQQDQAFELFEKHGLHPQIWKIMPAPQEGSQEERVEAAARAMLPLVKRTAAMKCKLGIYNHGGWNGEPKNMVAVVEWLREHASADHVGIVYNFHHGHEHMADFADSLREMKPYLLCINLNGMNDNAQPKILPIGDGKHELGMMKTLLKSGYRGPVGVLDHRPELDAEESLLQNLEGLEAAKKKL